MIYGDVCTGIGAASAAWGGLGWRPAFFAEIDGFPSKVLAQRYSGVKNHGDFTTIQNGDYEPIDLLVGGTPCQDFSIAGLRAGIGGDRGNLTLEFLRLAGRLRPRWLVWENVPGVFSSCSDDAPDHGGDGDGRWRDDANESHAFACFLAGLQELGYGFAYRTLDAQHFGVPQRRRRVFVVGYLGDWRRAAAVLFESHCLSGDTPPRREKGQSAPTIPARSTGGGGLGTDFDCDGGLDESSMWPKDVAPTLGADYAEKWGLDDQHIRGGQVSSSTGDVAHCLNAGGMGRQDFETETLISVGGFFDEPTHSLRPEGYDASEDGTGRGTPLVPVAYMPARTLAADGEVDSRYAEREVCDALHSGSGGGNKAPLIGSFLPSSEGNFDKEEWERSGRLVPVGTFQNTGQGCGSSSQQATRSTTPDGGGSQEANVVAYSIQAGSLRENPDSGPDGVGVREDGIAYTLEARSEVQAVAFDCKESGQHGFGVGEIASTLRSMGHMHSHQNGGGHLAVMTLAIRGRDGEPNLEVREDGVGQAILTPNGGRGGGGIGAVAIDLRNGTLGPQTQTLQAAGLGDERGGNPSAMPATFSGMSVRRLTPLECERLQGFPDHFTKLDEKTADGPRYKALGNSMAVPVMEWIGKRIQMVDEVSQ